MVCIINPDINRFANDPFYNSMKLNDMTFNLALENSKNWATHKQIGWVLYEATDTIGAHFPFFAKHPKAPENPAEKFPKSIKDFFSGIVPVVGPKKPETAPVGPSPSSIRNAEILESKKRELQSSIKADLELLEAKNRKLLFNFLVNTADMKNLQEKKVKERIQREGLLGLQGTERND